MPKLIQAQKDLRKFASREKSQILQRFFKTGSGQYGAGDIFIGVKVPETRLTSKKHKDLSFKEISHLLKSGVHEDRLMGLLILVDQYKRADQLKRKKIFQFYLKYKSRMNNWDLVDTSAPQIVGEWLFETDDPRLLYKLVKSKNLWDRRIAVLATFAFLRKGRHQETIELSLLLLEDKEDLMHKATGWMLREVGKRDLKSLVKFLNQNAHVMPRTMLRYSIEKLSPGLKKRYMRQKYLLAP
ncbi:MAG: DNA alkylation repair protein [Oligoflexia bacterium]|nr:MAG: DNA alkylation repair protein [Oligoflexia bacterium]